MWYLFLQIWVWLLAAFVLGWLAHWFLCCRSKANEIKNEADITLDATPLSSTAVTSKLASSDIADHNDWKPQGFTSQPDTVDDLKRIKGIGAVIEETLHGLGIYQFKQIADWSSDNITWVEKSLAFPGRIAREEWQTQARTLDQGGTTEFAKRVDKGEVGYNG